MNKYFLMFFCIIIILESCNQTEEKYYWVSFDKRYENTDSNQIFHIEKTILSDTVKFSYLSKLDTIKYFFLNGTRDSSFIEGYYKEDGHLRPLFDTTVLLDKDTFNVTEYILNEHTADGASIHYYVPTIGVYAIHSSTWPGITYLQTTGTLINRKIKRLMKITIPDFFIRGQFEKILNE
jgi:hypothetical protein